MIELVDQHIVSRFTPIKLDGNPIKIYAPGASRPKGKTVFTSVAISRYLPFDIDIKQARVGIDVFTPSVEEQTVPLPDVLGVGNGGEAIGPATWDVQQYPIPIILYYQIDLIATEQAHANALLMMLLAALPCPYRPKIAEKNVLILPNGPPQNLDELEKPYFRTAARYLVSNVWINRFEKYTVQSIPGVEMTWGTEG